MESRAENVMLVICRRPSVTRETFAAIRHARPARLFVVADGPAPGHEAQVSETRDIVKAVDWHCDVHYNFADQNLGSPARIRSGLAWMFEQVDEAIVVEDDCVPHPSFFGYCNAALAHFRNHPEVWSINGCNLGYKRPRAAHSYRFTRFMNMWGWATWRRTFDSVDWDMKSWPVYRASGRLEESIPDLEWLQYWTAVFDAVHANPENSWDYQWIYSTLRANGLVISPICNMVRNDGWTADATNTSIPNHPLGRMRLQAGPCELDHPPTQDTDESYERYLKLMWTGVGW